MTRDKRRELRERLMKAAPRVVTFFAIGAVCPKCGYVFSNGFANVHHGGVPKDETATPCTRCMSWLVIRVDGTLRVMTPDERAQIEDELAKNEVPGNALALDLVKYYRESKS